MYKGVFLLRKINSDHYIVAIIMILSFALKLILIFYYKNQLTLSSDDLNYIKSAVVLIKRGIFIFYGFGDPTVFVMPGYPFFLAAVFKVFGYGVAGLQVVRILQALISCVTILMVFLIGKSLFNQNVGLLSAFLVGFYFPNIVTTGYILTETIFTAMLSTLVYYSIRMGQKEKPLKFGALPRNATTSHRQPEGLPYRQTDGILPWILGLLWATATMIRPTMALYPIFFFLYLLVNKKYSLWGIFKLGMVMTVVFAVFFVPWWVRNYLNYGEFIPLSAASGNPMLQGTYVNYQQTPENTIYYKLGKNSFETNKAEVAAAKKRMAQEFKKDFLGYLAWYTVGKTVFFWATPFYWKTFFHMNPGLILVSHYILLLGLVGMLWEIRCNSIKFILPVSIILYFNVVHCYYMAFDRYAFPVLPLVTIFSAKIISRIYSALKHKIILY